MTPDKLPPTFASDINNLCIDFDGVIHNDNLGFHDGTCYGDPIPGSLDSIKMLSTQFRIVIFTAKAKPDRPLVNGLTGTQLVWDWLGKHGIDNCVSEVTSEKPRGFLYIDDNGYRFNNWVHTVEFIKELQK
jgi:hypothetical protein